MEGLLPIARDHRDALGVRGRNPLVSGTAWFTAESRRRGSGKGVDDATPPLAQGGITRYSSTRIPRCLRASA
jgi:hypothetical protein